MKPFFDRLVPQPLERGHTDWPPPQVQEALVQEFRAQERWAELEALARTRWERNLERVEEIRSLASARSAFVPYLGNWGTEGAPLAEALLQLGRAGDADGIVRAWAELGGRFNALQPLIALARKLGHEALATAWAELAKPEPARPR